MKNITREEALKMWLTTLEQHPERQTISVLGRTEGKFCCLGQLCHLLYEEDEITTSKNGEFYFYGSDFDSELLPKEIVDFMHFFDNSGCIEEDRESDDRKYSLADMNDNGTTWPEIANFIRENPEKVFVS